MLDIVNSIIEAIKTKNVISLWIIVIIAIVIILWKIPKSRHKRYLSRTISTGFIFCILWTFYFDDYYSLSVLIYLSIFFVVLIIIAFRSVKKPIFPETRSISHFENLVREGRYTEIEKRYSKRPFFISSTPGKIKWNSLNSKKLLRQGKLKDAYQSYSELLKLSLFDKEKNEIRLSQVLVLLMLGDTNTARSVFEKCVQSRNSTDTDEILHLQSMFDERVGNFDEALRNLLLATREHEDVKSEYLASIYNNLGRMEMVLGNTTNTILYYRKSKEIAVYLKQKFIIHIAYPNLIDTYLLNMDIKNAGLLLDEYSKTIDKKNIDDLLAFNNYLLVYARQTKDRALFLDTLTRGRIEIIPNISHQEQLNFEISELRIRWSSQCGWDEKLFWVRYHLSEYLSLKFPDSYLTLKEIFNILIDLKKTNNLGPFTKFYYQLLDFMGNSKEDIDRHILNLPDYCVYERCYWEKELSFLRKIQRPEELQMNLIDFYEGMFKHLCDIKNIQLEHGNPIQAVEADLNIADECMGVIQQITEQPVIDYLLIKMQKHLEDACNDLEKFRKHPISNEYLVRIARYALFLNDQKRAKEYYDEFVSSGISINHYAAWIQKYYHELYKFFSSE